MLARRKPPRLKPEPDKQKVFHGHRKYVRGFVCIVPNCDTGDKIQFCHVRKGLPANTPSWARPGKGTKSHDAFGFPGCVRHHIEQGNIGESAFERKHGVNLLKEALDLARYSKDEDVRAFVREYRL